MWCLWKVRNEKLFQRKEGSPVQVSFAAQAITNSFKLETGHTNLCKNKIPMQDKGEELRQGNTIDASKLSTQNTFFTDAAWNLQESQNGNEGAQAGIGVYIQLKQGYLNLQASISATGMIAISAVQTEAQGLKLAANLLESLHIQEAAVLTDNLTVAKAAAARSPRKEPGNWQIRSYIADFCAMTEFKNIQVYHVNRDQNSIAHEAARDLYFYV
uniref:Uncharacterized protein n=1 Tax=Aegilops tauschii TaxID=37682 RepID=M8BQF1_AEGTA